jgi:hypothetical protein
LNRHNFLWDTCWAVTHDEPSAISCYTATDLDNIILGLHSRDKYISKFSQILGKTARYLSVTEFLDLETLSILYNSLSVYKNGLMYFPINLETKTNETRKVVSEKTLWVSQELQNAERLPSSRLEDLRDFCVDLSRNSLNPSKLPIKI